MLRKDERVVVGLFCQRVIGDMEEVCLAFFADNRELWPRIVSKVVEIELALGGGVGGFSKLHNRELDVLTDRAGVTTGPVWIFGALPGADLVFGRLFDEVDYCVRIEVAIDIVRIGGGGHRLAGRNIGSSVGGDFSVLKCDYDGSHRASIILGCG